MMSEEQQFCLRWNNFQANITSQFEALRDEEDFVDVTLACDGQRLKAHKVVLSACSPYFKELFKSNPCKHPILFLRDVAFHHLRALVEFMYAGEVNVAQAQLSAFLRTAESLQIRGLTEAPQRHKQSHRQQQAHQQQQQTHQQQQQAHQQQQQQVHHQPSAATEVTGSVGIDSSSAAEEIASSPECVGIDEEEDALSLSPSVGGGGGGGGTSPTPAKRQCLQQDGIDTSHQRSHTSSSDLEAATKDNPIEIVEPKLELPDYSSDGESKTGTAAFLGLDSNSVDVNASFAAALHGGVMDILPGPSGQSFLGEPSASLDSGQVDHRKLHSLDPRPCPICNRMYSNLSNLRQHVRLIHNPQTVACPLCNKPFKTKLYLKRHLMSFHELLCTNNGPGGSQMVPKQNAAEFYPPPPQVFLGSHTVGEEEDTRKISDGLHKGKEQNYLEMLSGSRGSMVHNPTHDEKSVALKNKDSQDVFHSRVFQTSGMHHVTHDEKSNFHNTLKSKHAMDLFQMPRMFQNVISPSQSNSEDKNNYTNSGSSSQHSKTKDSVRNFHSEEEKTEQQSHSEYFQSTRSFYNASQSGSEEKNNNFQSTSLGHSRSRNISPDMYHSGRNFGNGEDRNTYSGTGNDKETSSYNHKEENFATSQNRNQNHSPKQENSSACSNFMGALSLTNNENARLSLMSGSGGEGLSFNSQDDSVMYDDSFSEPKHGQSESSMETEALTHESNNNNNN